MGNVRQRRVGIVAAIGIVTAFLVSACSLLAPSDSELMGGLTQESSEAGSDASDSGDASSPREAAPPCDAGGNGASCSSPSDCCSGKCRGNGLCL